MNYIFGLPKGENKTNYPMGGKCISENLICLYAFKWKQDRPNATVYDDFILNRCEITFWSKLLEHEHVHTTLLSIGLKIDEHHSIMDKISELTAYIGVGKE